MWHLDLVTTLSLSIKILYFLGLDLSLIIPLLHFGCSSLFESGFCSYRTLVPTGNFGNSLPVFGKFNHFSDIFLFQTHLIFDVGLSWVD